MNAPYPNRVAEVRREYTELSRHDLAEALGVAYNTASRLENGLIALTYHRVEQLSELFGCHPGELFRPLPLDYGKLRVISEVAAGLDEADFDHWMETGRRLRRLSKG